MEISRNELISICEDGVVHHTKWTDRDSYLSQVCLQSIYQGLKAGLPYQISPQSDEDTIWIEFLKPIDLDKLNSVSLNALKISSREDYFRDCDPEYDTEMFDGLGIEFTCEYTAGYMPTRKRLDDVGIGEDWY